MKKIIINEEQGNMLFNKCRKMMDGKGHGCKQYPINPEKVLIVKKFLDNNFERGDFENVGDDGLPSVTKIVVMKGQSGNPLKNMYIEQLEDLLQEKFKNMFSDEDEKMKFLGQVMRDWYDNKIGLYGSLSVNHL